MNPCNFVPLAIIAFLLLSGAASAKTHIAKTAVDVSAVLSNMQDGDTLRIAKGTIRETIRINRSNIRVEGFGVTLSGYETLTLDWKKSDGAIYTAKVAHPVNQLLVNGVWMSPARWPNMTFDQRWNNTCWRATEAGSRYGRLIDGELANTTQDFTGCIAILNIGSWQTFRRLVTKHDGQALHYVTDPNSRLVDSKPHPVGMDRYCLHGRAALDAPGEWFYDQATATLHFWPPAGQTPDTLRIESKVLPVALIVEDCHHVEIAGFTFRGTTFRFEQTHHCTLEYADLEYPSAIAHPFGPNTEHPATSSKQFSAVKWFGESSVDALTTMNGHNNTLRNTRIRFAEGPAFTLIGDRCTVENVLCHDIDWHGLDYGFGVDLLAAPNALVRKLTLHHAGGSEGLRLSNTGKTIVEYCHLHHCGLRQSDGAIIQTSTPHCAGTEIRYNWIHDHHAFNWGGNGIRADDQSRGLIVHHNAVWNCSEKGIVVKGDHHQVYNNTCVNNQRIDILIPRNRLPGKTKELTEQNRHSAVYNNLGKVQGNWSWEKPELPPYAKTENNYPDAAQFLLNPDKRDFRLKPSSKLHDVGAYPKGQPAWTAGADAQPHIRKTAP